MTKVVLPPFELFSKPIFDKFTKMSKDELFTTVDGDALWELYLQSYPEGTNPIYKTRTEHDCSCCKNFVRNVGTAVSVVNGKLQSIWDVKGLPYPYDEVAKALHEFVISAPITGLFRKSEISYGAEKSIQLQEDGTTKRWSHFHGKIAARHYTKSVGEQMGTYASVVQVFERGLRELDNSSLQTVLDLIDSKSIYRGEEHLPAIRSFTKEQNAYKKLKNDLDRNIFVWANANSPAARFRNTVIGTLIQDLSSGVDIENAVRSFESKVAPTNYKRTTVLITPRMVQDAMKTIKDMNLETALERRFAKISDVSVNNVLWVDNSVRSKMIGGVENLLMSAAKASPKKKKDEVVEDIGIEDFMSKILPEATSLELFVSNTQLNNFMSITAPVHADSEKLFKWSNDFGWSYNGNITDSIKEKVKKAGGNVTNAKLRVSLAWYNTDDLDIHVTEPNGNTVCFYNKQNKLDVDMNIGGESRTPVENISWTTVADGKYTVNVNQYNKRNTSDVGCVIEVESGGALHQMSYNKSISGTIKMATLTVANGKVVEIVPGSDVVGGGVQQEKWGITTEANAKVSTVMYSPNYWNENAVGNKHWFFILEGCKCDEATRGIYNEFLRSDLEKHRKVFEVLGDKTKCQPTEEQLSGLGFSSTRGDSVKISVSGPKMQKIFNIKF